MWLRSLLSHAGEHLRPRWVQLALLAVTQLGLGFVVFRAIFDLQVDLLAKIRTMGVYYRLVALPLYVHRFVLNPTEVYLDTETQTEKCGGQLWLLRSQKIRPRQRYVLKSYQL